MKGKSFSGSLLLLLTAMIWGFAFVAQKSGGDALGPFSVTCLRSVIATAFLLLILPVLDRLRGNGRRLFIRRNKFFTLDLTKTELVGGALCGLALGSATLLQQIGLLHNDSAGKTAFITSLYVALVPILGLFLRRKTAPVVFLGVGGALLGAYLLAFPADEMLALSFGDLLVFLCAVVFAIHILVIDRFSPRCDGVRMSIVQFFVSALISAPVCLVAERPTLAAVGDGLLSLLYLGILSSGVAYTLQILAQSRTHPAVASVIMSLESVFGMVGGALFFGESMSTREYIGCAVLFLSVILTELGGIFYPRKKQISEDKQI